MERSMSLDSGTAGHENTDSTNNIVSINSNNHNNNSKNINTTTQLHKAFELELELELRQSHLEQYTGSDENHNKQTNQLNKTKSMNSNSNNANNSHHPHSTLKGIALTHFLPKRKRPLQRQKPMEPNDDIDYAADLEEEDEEDDENVRKEERIAPQHTPKVPIAPAHQKRLQYQKYRQHSNLATIAQSVPNSPPTFISASTATQCPLPAHSLAHHATRSSSTSSATSLESHFKHQDSFESSVSLPPDTPKCRRQQFFALKRDNSMQSDSSRYSSLECMLEARKPDPEAILINLGFGPVNSDDILSRIPARFLKPSQVRGIDTDAFVKRLQLQLQLADHSVLGYRGLTGNPDMPPSSIVAKIMQRFEVNERKKSMGSLEHTI